MLPIHQEFTYVWTIKAKRSTSSHPHVLHQRKKAKQRPHEDVSVDTETRTMAIHTSPSAYMGDMLDEYNNSILKTNHSWINKISMKVPRLWILYNAGNFISVRQKLPMWLSWKFCSMQSTTKGLQVIIWTLKWCDLVIWKQMSNFEFGPDLQNIY